jgi:hypothetical protein
MIVLYNRGATKAGTRPSLPRSVAAYADRVPRFLPKLTLPTAGWSLGQWQRNHEFNAWIGAAVGLFALRAGG